jgi:hypothetical protein
MYLQIYLLTKSSFLSIDTFNFFRVLTYFYSRKGNIKMVFKDTDITDFELQLNDLVMLGIKAHSPLMCSTFLASNSLT